MKKNAIICIAAGNSQLPIIRAARKKGLEVIAIDRNPEAPGFYLTSEQIVLSTYDSKSVIEVLFTMQGKYEFNGVICRASDLALYTASEIAKEFKLCGYSKDLVPLATEKAHLREFSDLNGLPMPKGVKVKFGQDYNNDIQLPLIVKPNLPRYGKKDITAISDRISLPGAIRKACESSRDSYAEIEEYIEGIDVSILFYMDRGKSKIITYWDELVAIDEHNSIKGLGVSVPSVIVGTDIQTKIDAVVAKLASQFDTTQALMILSARIDFQGNLFIIELHADLGGDLIADELLPRADSSFDFFEMAVNVACGDFHGKNSPKLHPTAILYNRSQYDHKSVKGFQTLENNLLYSGATLLEHHKVLKNLFSNFEYCSIPEHHKWMQVY